MKLLSLCALLCAAALSGPLRAADAKPLFNGKNLDGWEIIGDGQWTVMSDGTVLGQRITDLRKQISSRRTARYTATIQRLGG